MTTELWIVLIVIFVYMVVGFCILQKGKTKLLPETFDNEYSRIAYTYLREKYADGLTEMIFDDVGVFDLNFEKEYLLTYYCKKECWLSWYFMKEIVIIDFDNNTITRVYTLNERQRNILDAVKRHF